MRHLFESDVYKRATFKRGNTVISSGYFRHRLGYMQKSAVFFIPNDGLGMIMTTSVEESACIILESIVE